MSNISTLSERSLIENCINGNRKSQKELYERFAPKMFAICLHYARNQSEAEYMLQDGFVKLFSNLYRFDNHHSFENWVKRIFIKIATSASRSDVRLINKKTPENMLEFENKEAFNNIYHEVFSKTAEKSFENFHSAFKLYAVQGYLSDKTAEDSTFTKANVHQKFQNDQNFTLGNNSEKTVSDKKKVNFTYTLQQGDHKRINKKGILRVYNLSEPIDIPVVRILGRWKREHVGVTLVAINDKWCIKGGAAEYAIPKRVVNESLPVQLFKKLVW